MQNYSAAYDIKMNWVPQGAGSTPILLKKVEGSSLLECRDDSLSLWSKEVAPTSLLLQSQVAEHSI